MNTTAHTTRADHNRIIITVGTVTWEPDDYSADTWSSLTFSDVVVGTVQLEYGVGWYWRADTYMHPVSTDQRSASRSGISDLFIALKQASEALTQYAVGVPS